MLQQDLFDLERRDVNAASLDHLLQSSAKTDTPVHFNRAKIAGQKIAILVERLSIKLRRPVITGGDVTADRELADFALRQGPPRNEIHCTERHSGQREALAPQSELQRIAGIGHRAIAVGFGRPVDIAELLGSQRLYG